MNTNTDTDKPIAKPIDLDLAESRTAICATCPSLLTKLGFEFCAECGCLLMVKRAIKLATCPLGKW